MFQEQRDDEDKKDAYARSKSPQKSFVQYFRSPSRDNKNSYKQNSFFLKSITTFQNNFKPPVQKHTKSLHQQSFLFCDTDVTSDDDDHIYIYIYTRIPECYISIR